MNNEINFSNILNIYEKEISKNVKNKKKLRDFENNKMQNINNIIGMLKNDNIGHTKYNIFLIHEPKYRLVMSLDVKDKIINHFVTRFSLEINLSKYLDFRNAATRKDMGTDYAVDLLVDFIEKNKKYDDLYALKIDISKYFYNINHDILKSMLKNKLCSFDYNLICKIIDSTDYEYINENIKAICKLHNIDLPIYKKGRGLPIGNMTSQFLSIFYLHEIDHYIINDLGLKYFVRYMDDFVILSNDLTKLKEAKVLITNRLREKYDLEVNSKKTKIFNAKYGFTFLGYNYMINKNKKTIVLILNSNFKKIKKRVKAIRHLLFDGFISHESAFCTIMTYSNCYIHSNKRKILNIIDRYFYHE